MHIRQAVIMLVLVTAAASVTVALWKATAPREVTRTAVVRLPAQTPSAVPATRSAEAAPVVAKAATPAVTAATAATASPAARTTTAARVTPAARTTAATTAAPARPLASEGQVLITSSPAGARVTVSGIGWGVTPLTIRHMTLGAKRIRVTKDGYVGQERAVNISGQQPSAKVHIVLPAQRRGPA